MSDLSRQALRDLAQARVEEAEILLTAGRFGGAYYLGGYCIEIGLKACIAAQFVADEIPDWVATDKFKTHGLIVLLGYAGLDLKLKTASKADQALERNWDVVTKWKTSSRYSASMDEQTAREFIAAVSDPASGAFRWIRTHW